ncbi:Hypothetical protein LUCI_3423 [Lucifera butyrica]|uniref:Uncharacterized protein n=1 Tax=Lucifera butyrica TaxID=1351585 RepID=A0A498RGC3_9FIRM|nr:hypothetical protein [Lucifera butyrica]VBB08158.1 Hypothetical protein LUCI_3423 [Lucifera butyrica]
MATVGQQLTAPETGWKRYDTTDSGFNFSGDWQTVKNSDLPSGNYYDGSMLFTSSEGKVAFKFFGTKLRIITDANTDHSNKVQITIDGIVSEFSTAVAGMYQRLSFEKTDLELSIHEIEITNLTDTVFGFDAIDIDEEGYLVEPVGHCLLRITMTDSSEREYELTSDQISQFIDWCNRTVGTGNAYYAFDKTYNVGEFKDRKEYLMFEQIISFEVMELTK